jgi:hypothetical protein
MSQTTRTRTHPTLKTPAVTVSDEQQRDEFWDVARKALDELDKLHYKAVVAAYDGISELDARILIVGQRATTFPVMDHQLTCWFEAVEAVREMPPLLTAGPARIEGAS